MDSRRGQGGLPSSPVSVSAADKELSATNEVALDCLDYDCSLNSAWIDVWVHRTTDKY